MRRAFSASTYVHNPRTCRTLLIHHQRHDLWLPPGGEREGDETPLETAKRELEEETGWQPSTLVWPAISSIIGAPDGMLSYEEHDSGSKGLHMNFVFLALLPDKLAMQDPEPIPTSDGSWESCAWATALEHIDAKRRMPNNVKQALLEISRMHSMAAK